MSSGPSCWKLNPRSAASTWSEAKPRSAKRPSTSTNPTELNTPVSWSKLACVSVTGKPARLARARSSMAGSCSRPMPRPVGPTRWAHAPRGGPDASGQAPGMPAGPGRGIDPDLRGLWVEQGDHLAGQHRHMPRRLRGHTAAGKGGQGGFERAVYNTTKMRYAATTDP